ncbi:Rad51c, partial [Symbiodinium sp. CCMP2592]
MAYRSPLVLCLVAAAVLLIAPQAFVPSPKSQTAGAALAAGAAAGSMAVPAWAYDQQVMDAQMLLARIPGGKRTQELGLVIPMAEEDGLTDGQVAGLFLIALVVFISAIDLAKTMYNGINPAKFKTSKGKGYISPLVKRYIENGLNGLLGSALHGGGALLEAALCCSSDLAPQPQTPQTCEVFGLSRIAARSLAEPAIYVDTEGSFVPERYMQVCEALLSETRPTLDAASVCRLLEARLGCADFMFVVRTMRQSCTPPSNSSEISFREDHAFVPSWWTRLPSASAMSSWTTPRSVPGCNAVFRELKCNVMPVQITVLWEVSERFVRETIAKIQQFGIVSRPHVHVQYADIGHAAFDLGSTQSTPTSSLVGLARAHSAVAHAAMAAGRQGNPGGDGTGSWKSDMEDSIGKELSDFRERALEVASTCATDFEATSALPRSVLEPHWSADFESFCWQSIPLIDPARFSLDHLIRPSCEGLHAQIEVHVDHASGQKVVAKRFTRAYLHDSPRAFRESDAFCGEDPWTEMFLAMKLGQDGPDRIKGVLPCYGVYRDASDSALLIMEWASGGDVFEYASSLGEPGPAREAQ